MNVLGIETSCDETSAAVVKDGRGILSNVTASSLEDHKKYGGVIPEIASRRQLEFISAVVEEALDRAGVSLEKIDAVAVTNQPGLIGSLLVGISFARALSFARNKPLAEVDHIKAHVYAAFLSEEQPKLPAIGLVVSGGHTNLYLVQGPLEFKLLGQTLDDAAGEAFDKVARILGLGYPGGPAIDRLAAKTSPTALSFRCANLTGTFDFSFSGIKTAVFYHQQKKQDQDDCSTPEAAYAFQKSVVDVLTKKCLEACQKLKTKTLLVGGGVAGNSALRKNLRDIAQEHGIRVYLPSMSLCTDNAAMIAGLGYHVLRKNLLY